MRWSGLAAATSCFLLLLAGCARPQTAAPLDPSIQALAPAAPPPTPSLAEPLSPAMTTEVGACTNDARFIEDLTIPDGSVVSPGVEIDKRWSVRNAGTCDWGPGYRLVPLEMGGLSGPAEVALFPALAGATVPLQVVLVAPASPGEYHSIWQAHAPDGTTFGDTVFLVVNVEPVPEILVSTSTPVSR